MALLFPSAHALAQKVVVTWGSEGDISEGTVTSGTNAESSLFTVGDDATVTLDYTLTNLAISEDGGETYTKLVPEYDPEGSEIDFTLTHSVSGYTLKPYNKLKFTAYAIGAALGGNSVTVDVYLRYASGGEVLLEEGVNISNDADKPTEYEHEVAGYAISQGKTFSVILKVPKWREEAISDIVVPGVDATDITAGGIYMLQDVESGNYIGGGYDYGTQATMLPQPQQFTFHASDDYYTLSSYQKESGGKEYFGKNLYVNAASNIASFSFEEGSEEGTYYLYINDVGYLVSSKCYTPITSTTDKASASLWRIISQENIRNAQDEASSTQKVDVTGLIDNPTLNYESENRMNVSGNTEYWEVEEYASGTKASATFGYAAVGGAGNAKQWANVVETYHQSNGFNVYQEVTLKPGKYKFSAQGFYRLDSGEDDGSVVLYASPTGGDEVSTRLMAMSDNSDSECSGIRDTGQLMYNAYHDFQNGLYPVEVEFEVEGDEETEVALGFKGNLSDAWTALGELNLTYYGTGDEAIGSNITHTCEAKIEDWSTTGNDGTFVMNDWSTESDPSGMVTPFCQNWVVSGSTLTNATISHKQLTGLYPGKYEVSIDARIFAEDTSVTSILGTTLFTANGKSVNLVTDGTSGVYQDKQEVYGTYTVTCEVGAEGILDISFSISDANYNWLAWKNLKVEYETSALIGISNVTLENVVDAEGSMYEVLYGDDYSPEAEVEHKAAKWYTIRSGKSSEDYGDNFGKDTETVDHEGMVQTATDWGDGTGTWIQATHEYVDTIYMRKGSSITIKVPTFMNSNGSSTATYHRWFNYLNDQNFYCGGGTLDSGADLLTPYSSSYIAWRFENGYVTGMMNDDNTDGGTYTLRWVNFYYPTDAEYDKFKNNTNFSGQPSNAYYAVACDMSLYTDFAEEYVPNSPFGTVDDEDNIVYHEPTLALRALYYIVGIDDDVTVTDVPEKVPVKFQRYWKLFGEDGSYRGGGNAEKKYFNEFNITFPSRRTSQNTIENVTLPEDAQAYGILGESTTDKGSLSVAFAIDGLDEAHDISSIFTLATSTLSGDSRVIQFYKTENDSTNEQWKVNDGSTVTILVTKEVNDVTYNIARYNLTFKDECIPLTEPQVAGLADMPDDCTWWWKDMGYRSPKYLEANYKLLTSLDFDYSTDYSADKVFSSVTYNSSSYNGQSPYYSFPLKWDWSSYAFYDGSPQGEVLPIANSIDGFRLNTQWGMYSIMNDYKGYGDWVKNATKKPQYPSVKNSSGYWLYIDASDRPGTLAELTFDNNLCSGSEIIATAWIKSSGEQGKTDAAVLFTVTGVTKNGEHVPIYSQSSGQIETTTYMNFLGHALDEGGLEQEVTGKGEGTNEWFQLYFSFMNVTDDNGDNTYEYYTLRIDNCCSSTNGGDFYIDEIRLYVNNPAANATQIKPSCSSSSTAIRVDIDYTTMLSRLTGKEESDETEGENDGTETVDMIIVNRVAYEEYLSDNGYYSESDSEKQDAIEAKAIKAAAVKFYSSSASTEGTYYKTLTFNSWYAGNTAYDTNNAGNNYNEADGESELYRLTLNGVELLSIDLYTDVSSYTPYIILLKVHGADLTEGNWLTYFCDQIYGNTCAMESEFYVTATTTLRMNGEIADPTITPCAGQTYHITPTVNAYLVEDDEETITALEGVYFDWFIGTEEEYTENYSGYEFSLQTALEAFRTAYPDAEVINDTETPVNGSFTENYFNLISTLVSNNLLILHQQYLDLKVSENGIRLVIQPIRITILNGEEDISEYACWSYVTLMMENATNSAPYLNTGFSNISDYPYNYVPNLRLGLSHMTTNEDKPITVYLRDASGNLALIENEEYLYLVETSDPAFTEDESLLLNDEDFNEYNLPIGKIKKLSTTTDGGTGNLMEIYFSESFFEEHNLKLSEGYYYTVVIHFKNSDDEDACDGSLPIEIKVVPEYLVWQGNRSKNWNNDDNWAMVNDATNITYSNVKAGRSGYVPMKFSKVVMLEDSEAELYMGGFTSDDSKWTWEGDLKTAKYVTESTTANIMYDLMVYEKDKALTTGRYRVNICDSIHFEPGAMMLHSEYLNYEKAWTNVAITPAEWTLVSTPLQGVVSGDWYTKSKTGTETEKYFNGIEFGDDNDRENPMVFQRSWGTTSTPTIVYTSSTDIQVPAYTATGWTSVYNDASVEQTVGEGFSIKAYTDSEAETLIFRFPKEDDSYDVSSTTLDRTNAGILKTNDLVTRNDLKDNYETLYSDGEPITATLAAVSGNGSYYCLVGNPFPARLSLSKFFEENKYDETDNPTGTLTGSYWLESTDGTGPVAGSGSMSTLGDNDVYIDPYSAFFAEVKSSAVSNGKVEVTFTKDMQTLESSKSSGVKAFSIKAQGTGGMSGAAVAYDGDASDEYSSKEDVVLLQDDSWSRDGLPLVYTVAGDKAVSINRLKGMTVIPLGVFSTDDSEYTLTFTGVDFLGEPSLYDAEEDTETPLTEGYTLDMQGASHGRYFIKTSADVTEEEDGLLNISVYSTDHRRVTVSSSAEIERVEVYSVSGMLQRRVFPSSVACTIDDIESGITVVSVHTSEGSAVRKITVR